MIAESCAKSLLTLVGKHQIQEAKEETQSQQTRHVVLLEVTRRRETPVVEGWTGEPHPLANNMQFL